MMDKKLEVVLLYLAIFLGVLGGVPTVEASDVIKNEINSKSSNLSPSVYYCNESRPCPANFEYCSSLNACSNCAANEHYDGHKCVRCAYPDTWDYSVKVCHYYMMDNDWTMWLAVGVAVALGLIVVVCALICCLKCPLCPLYLKAKAQARVEQSNLGFSAYEDRVPQDPYHLQEVLEPPPSYWTLFETCPVQQIAVQPTTSGSANLQIQESSSNSNSAEKIPVPNYSASYTDAPPMYESS